MLESARDAPDSAKRPSSKPARPPCDYSIKEYRAHARVLRVLAMCVLGIAILALPALPLFAVLISPPDTFSLASFTPGRAIALLALELPGIALMLLGRYLLTEARATLRSLEISDSKRTAVDHFENAAEMELRKTLVEGLLKDDRNLILQTGKETTPELEGSPSLLKAATRYLASRTARTHVRQVRKTLSDFNANDAAETTAQNVGAKKSAGQTSRG